MPERKRYHPSVVRKVLQEVFTARRTVETVAKEHGVELYTAYHWCQNAKKYGAEQTILSFYPKKDLIDIVMKLKTSPGVQLEHIEERIRLRK